MFAAARTLLFGGITGKVIGILREVVAAALLGTAALGAAFRLSQAAFFIPVQGLLSESLTSGFTPAYARDRARQTEMAGILFSGMHVFVFAGSVAIAIPLVIFAKSWVHLLAPGFNAGTADLTTKMVQCLAPAMPLYALTSLYASAQLAAGRPRMTATRATAQSVGLIFGIVLGWLLKQPLLIPMGFIAVYLWLTIWGANLLRAEGLRFWPRRTEWPTAMASVRHVWQAYRILIWVPAIMQVHFIVERRIASIDSVNAVAALDYARFMSDTAVILLAMPFAVAGLATMASASEDAFRLAASQSARLLLYLGVPISVALMEHANWIVRLTFARGAFGPDSVATTTTILQTLAAGLWGQLVGYAGTRYLNARRRNGTVLSIYLTAVATNVALNLLLQPLIGLPGLGIAASVNGMIVGLAVLNRLGLARLLAMDIWLLAFSASGYALLCFLLRIPVASRIWLPPVLFVTYWTLTITLIPRFRVVLRESWELVRHREQ